MKLKGKIQRILPMQQGTSKAGNNWQKVEFVIEEVGSEHPDIVCVSAMNDHVQELLGLNVGDTVDVDFSCRCNEYNGRVYNSISLFKIEKVGVPQPQAPQPMPQPQQAQNETLFHGNDDLPF